MKIKRLRLLGFKSFVEPTELVIEPGLTGVVGPNGCGKSNLLEALRWVMGETSHKSMRAAAMDDVIFAGTNHRPARNSAEVTIFIDNGERKAPAEFNDADIIEITRRIEREAGSAYRINGREARARDIKILFEDAATGARSPALVRQGQIGELVNAKPENRRRILEDAAGVAGLHSRRHEAELRLKGAEANLARLNDVLGALNGQVESLKRQARAARRYKDISAEIRRGEALQAHLVWTHVQSEVEAEEAKLRETLATLGAAVELEARVVAEEAALAETIQPLRDEEATRAVILARLKNEQDNFEREAARASERERELRGRLEQSRRDIEREDEMAREAGETLARLDAEIAAMEDFAHDCEAEAAAGDKLAAVEKSAGEAERKVADLTNRAAEVRARRRSLEAGLAERREAAARIERQLSSLEAQSREIAARAPQAGEHGALSEEGRLLADELVTIEAGMLEAEATVRERADNARVAREAAANARLAAKALSTERETLARLIAPPRNPDYPPVTDSLKVAAGYETALGASLGDDLDAPTSPEAPVHWRLVEPARPDPALPAAAEPLSRYVQAPPALKRRLQQIGVVSAADGARLQPSLKPGQRLVSTDGDLWRWDGYVAASHGASVAAQRLAHQNRLAAVEADEAAARSDAERLSVEEARAATAHAEAEHAERTLRQRWREGQARLSQLRERLSVAEQAAREREARLAGLAETREHAAEELIAAHERLSEMETTLELLAEDDDLLPQLEVAQTAAASARTAVLEARATLAALQHEARQRGDRISSATAERDRWIARQQGAERQLATLRSRLTEAETELEIYADWPQLIAEKRQKLLNELADAERQRQTAADRLAAADSGLRAAAQALRSAQAAVGEAREARARIEARLEAARNRRQDEARRIRETLDIVPEGCLRLAAVEDGAALPGLAELERQLQRLKADRERLGGVNLQADEELEKISAQFQSIDKERTDIEEAVGKLRGAIGQLNREAKARLKQAFDSVDGHFRRLFTTLFMGGEARLELIESEEDPLQGGLEIIAKPPGKKPATLSLLSGGEQTLTALSLIFAVFLTNPSPICVLDEVDAPLDDSNVDRFATLMEKMADETDTRFLVITHHPMTMVRMNRLFGVTMGEKGVSQLVSVDLETAQGFVGEEAEDAA